MRACLRTIQFYDQIRETVDDGRLLVEAGRRVDHPEHTQPGDHAVQIAQFALEIRQDRKREQTGGFVRLLGRDVLADLAKR